MGTSLNYIVKTRFWYRINHDIHVCEYLILNTLMEQKMRQGKLAIPLIFGSGRRFTAAF
jgi:hypothetical protein